MNHQTSLQAAIDFGLVVDSIIDDHEIHRVGTKSKPRGKNGWYISYGELVVMGDWQTGDTQTWTETGGKLLPAQRNRIKQAMQSRQQQKARAQQQAATNANNLYNNAAEAATHPYMAAKGIRPAHGLRAAGGWLLVPLVDVASNKLVNLQRIAPDGTKLFLKDGQIKGAACPVGLDTPPAPNQTLYICEGYATAYALHVMTAQPVLAAMNACNLLSVAREAQRKWSQSNIVIAGDDDYLTSKRIGFNIGLEKAKQAALAIQGKVTFPPFTQAQREAGLTDWNDYYLASMEV